MDQPVDEDKWVAAAPGRTEGLSTAEGLGILLVVRSAFDAGAVPLELVRRLASNVAA